MPMSRSLFTLMEAKVVFWLRQGQSHNLWLCIWQAVIKIWMALLPVCSEYPHCMNYNFFSLCICARIQESHICELSKEWLKEMGITAIGDVMTILRHSQVKKQVSMCNCIFRCIFLRDHLSNSLQTWHGKYVWHW